MAPFLLEAGFALSLAAPAWAQSAASSGPFSFKVSGYDNATGAEVASQPQAGAGVLDEGEIELTPQYRTPSGTVLAARGVANVQGLGSDARSAWRVSVPEVSIFAIGTFGRFELGERAGFPQSLVGFTPSEIAFTSPGFGPEAGTRLDPNGGLPTSFLPAGLGSRINALTYLGYAARGYADASPKLVYLTPRSKSGFYGAISYTPRTERPSGFPIADGVQDTTDPTDRSLADPVLSNVVQAALVWTHRTELLDLSAGATYAHANADARSSVLPLRHSDSVSGGISATVRDEWTFGVSGTYDGLSSYRRTSRPIRRVDTPYGVITSADYVAGSWTVGGYYQHATADSQTLVPKRDKVDIEELGVSYLVDHNHDLLGPDFHTDVRLFASVYVYRLLSVEDDSVRATQAGQVFLMGARFSFF